MVPYRVDITLEVDPRVPAAAAWGERLSALLAELPEGVTFTSKVPYTETAFVALPDAMAFFRTRVAKDRLGQNARSVMAWLTSVMAHRLLVVCNHCTLPMDTQDEQKGCRCTDRGGRKDDGRWSYRIFTPDLKKGEDHWSIGVAGLVQLARRPQDIQAPYMKPDTRRRILWFLNHIKESYGANS